MLGTPTPETWPGIDQLPDYKPSFPHWSPQDLTETVHLLEDDDGIDLLKVCSPHSIVEQSLTPFSLLAATTHLRHG